MPKSKSKSNKPYQLIGKYPKNHWNDNIAGQEEVVATFDTHNDAEDYLHRSKMKVALSEFDGRCITNFPFRWQSVLDRCVSARIYQESDPPHNPILIIKDVASIIAKNKTKG